MVWLLKDQSEQYDWPVAALPFQFSVVLSGTVFLWFGY